MATEELPQTIELPFATLIQLAVEAWRLRKWLASQAQSGGAAPARYALGRIEQILVQYQFEARDLDGHAYDPGMAAEVADVTEDPTLPPGASTILQTMAPLVLWRGTVVQVATVAIGKGVQDNPGNTQG